MSDETVKALERIMLKITEGWEATAAGVAERAAFHGTAMTHALAGRGFDIILIDDPYRDLTPAPPMPPQMREIAPPPVVVNNRYARRHAGAKPRRRLFRP